MTIATLIEQLSQQGAIFFLIQTRFSVTFAALFFLRRDLIPVKILIGLSLALTIYCLNTRTIVNLPAAQDMVSLFSALLFQIFLGLITALIINLFAELFVGLGQVISMQSGLGFVNFFVPKIGTITPLSQFYIITATVIFFQLNGHLILLKMILESLLISTTFSGKINVELLKDSLLFANIIFRGSFMLSLAITIAVMLANITIAIMTKFSPQLNIFAIGINISLLICLLLAYLSFDLILDNGGILLHDILHFAQLYMLPGTS